MLKKLREFLSQKGQGTVEYALILGFVAIIAVYILTGSGLTKDVQKNIKNADTASALINVEYGLAAGTLEAASGGAEGVTGAPTPGSGPNIFPKP